MSDHEARVAATALAGLTRCPSCARWVKVRWARLGMARDPENAMEWDPLSPALVREVAMRSVLLIQGHDRSPNTRARCSASGQEVT